jgi:hypothetical protein
MLALPLHPAAATMATNNSHNCRSGRRSRRCWRIGYWATGYRGSPSSSSGFWGPSVGGAGDVVDATGGGGELSALLAVVGLDVGAGLSEGKQPAALEAPAAARAWANAAPLPAATAWEYASAGGVKSRTSLSHVQQVPGRVPNNLIGGACRSVWGSSRRPSGSS